MKILFVILFLIIVASLGSALFHFVHNKNKDPDVSKKILNALTMRIGLSLVLFILVVIAIATGLIKPTGIGSRIHPTQIPVTKDSSTTLETPALPE